MSGDSSQQQSDPQFQVNLEMKAGQQYVVQPDQYNNSHGQQPKQDSQGHPMHPMMVQGQPMMVQGQPMMVQGQPMMVQGQPMMVQGQPMMMQGQGMMAPGQNQVMWMAKPQAPVNCPPGLEYLTQLDQLLVKQKIEMMEVFTNFEMNNRYIVRNVLGQQIYFAHEESDCMTRQCCKANRPFTLHIEDNMGQEVIQVERPYKVMCCGQCCSCSKCCQDEVTVQAPPGEVVGYVKQLYEGCEIQYSIQNVDRQTILKIKGPSYCHCYCPGDDVPMQLLSADGSTEIGRISKQWSNLMREYFTDADNFGIQFPIDLEVRMKAVVLGAVFLIDFMYFENNNRRYR